MVLLPLVAATVPFSVAAGTDAKAQRNTLLATTQPDRQVLRQRYIGIEYRSDIPPYGTSEPKYGLRRIGGRLVALGASGVASPEYAIAHLKEDGTHMLWLEEIIARSPDGLPSFRVIDVLVLPESVATNLRNTNRYLLDASDCYLNDRKDLEIVALVTRRSLTAKYTDAVQAWRANRQTGKFESIPPQNVTCENPTWET